MNDTDRDELCRCESDCPGAAPFDERVQIPTDASVPSECRCERDTQPPSRVESDLEQGAQLNDELPSDIDSWDRQQLMVLMIRKQAQGNQTLRQLDERTMRLTDWQLEHTRQSHHRDERIACLERDRFWGSKIPLLVALVAMIASMLAMGMCGVQGWYLLTILGR